MWRRFILGILLLFGALFLALTIHMYIVTKPSRGQVQALTLTRVDFPKGLDSLVSVQVQERMATWDGVRDVRVNVEQGFVICLHDLTLLDSEQIVAALNFHFNRGAVVFRPDAALVSQSCPAINKESLTYRLGSFLQKSFQ